MASPRFQSKAKDAIYGCDAGRPLTPSNHGKKMVPGGGVGGGGGGGLPFATCEAGPDTAGMYPADFHKLKKAGSIVGKVGTHEISSNVYREQMELKHTVDAESRARNSGGPTPYAAEYVFVPGRDPAPAPHHALPPHGERAGEPTGKIGAGGVFDPEVYVRQREANAEIHEQTRTKRFGAGAEPSRSAPFATSDGFDELRRRDYYHAKSKPKGQDSTMAKPYGQQTFDPAPYSEQLRTNQSNQAESTQRNFVGSGHILAFDSQSRS